MPSNLSSSKEAASSTLTMPSWRNIVETTPVRHDHSTQFSTPMPILCGGELEATMFRWTWSWSRSWSYRIHTVIETPVVVCAGRKSRVKSYLGI